MNRPTGYLSLRVYVLGQRKGSDGRGEAVDTRALLCLSHKARDGISY
jgi:hypothetical protein